MAVDNSPCCLTPPGLTGGAVLFGFSRSLMIFYVLVCSAQKLHDAMFSAIIRTPVHFFDVNPIGESLLLCVGYIEERECPSLAICLVGRVLNRFSKDIGVMDSMLPITFVDFYQVGFLFLHFY